MKSILEAILISDTANDIIEDSLLHGPLRLGGPSPYEYGKSADTLSVAHIRIKDKLNLGICMSTIE